jgi:hypothetical protein
MPPNETIMLFIFILLQRISVLQHHYQLIYSYKEIIKLCNWFLVLYPYFVFFFCYGDVLFYLIYFLLLLVVFFIGVWEPSMGTSHRLPKPISKQQLDKQNYRGNQQS